MPDRDAALEAHLAETREARYESYFSFLRIPSISALPDHAADCRAAAAWLADALTSAGLEHVEVCETGGHPVVYADWLHAPGAPTVLVYGHYDVQPVDPLELWTSPPFEPVIEGERLLARGAADDKGQIHAHLMAAAAVLATRGEFPVNLRYLFEGEEESSSVNLDRVAGGQPGAAGRRRRGDQRHGLLRGQPAGDHARPARHDVRPDRRGRDGRRPALGQLRRGRPEPGERPGPDHRRAQGPGRPDPHPGLLRRRRAAQRRRPGGLRRAAVRRGRPTCAGSACPSLVGEVGYTTLERRGGRPTLDVNGIWGGFTGEGSKTIIPAHAHAKVSCRLVADQDPERVFEGLRAYVEQIAPPGVTTTVTLLGDGRPSLTPMDHPATQAAARALEATFGRAPVYIREGGSIPVVANFETILGLPVVLLGFVQPDDNAHAPNEWMDLRNYETGIRTIVRMWDELAAVRI